MTEYGDWRDLPLRSKYTPEFLAQSEQRRQQREESEAAVAPRTDFVMLCLDGIETDQSAEVRKLLPQTKRSLALKIAQRTEITDSDLPQFTSLLNQIACAFDGSSVWDIGKFVNAPGLSSPARAELGRQMALRWKDRLPTTLSQKAQKERALEFYYCLNFLLADGRGDATTFQLLDGLIDFYDFAHGIIEVEWHVFTRQRFVGAIMLDAAHFDWNKAELFPKQFSAMERLYDITGKTCDVHRDSWSRDSRFDTEGQVRAQIWKWAPLILGQQDQ